MEVKVEWKIEDTKYLRKYVAYLGKWCVGSVYFDGCAPRGTENRYIAKCSLPGIKERLGTGAIVEDAKTKVEAAISHWVNNAFPESVARRIPIHHSEI